MKICPLAAEFFHADWKSFSLFARLWTRLAKDTWKPLRAGSNYPPFPPPSSVHFEVRAVLLQAFFPQRPVSTPHCTDEHTDWQLKFQNVLHFPPGICSMLQQNVDVCIIQRHGRLKLLSANSFSSAAMCHGQELFPLAVVAELLYVRTTAVSTSSCSSATQSNVAMCHE